MSWIISVGIALLIILIIIGISNLMTDEALEDITIYLILGGFWFIFIMNLAAIIHKLLF